jgi:hypothetical protein
MKFIPSTNGQILGLRFYKGAGNTGTHLGNIWGANGNLLRSATFGNETESGWQEVYFAEPVDVAAGHQYTASYFAPNGNYSVTFGEFLTEGRSTPHLEVPPLAGVFVYTPQSAAPYQTYNGHNYWVDVIFVESDNTRPSVMFATPSYRN